MRVKLNKIVPLSLVGLGFLALFSVVRTLSADSKNATLTYNQVANFIPPAGLHSFDISWVDAASGTYYLADRTTGAGGRIDVVDAGGNSLGTIPGFVGNVGPGKSGPNGVVVIHKRSNFRDGWGRNELELWAGDGDSTVKVADLSTMSVVDTISTGGKFRADELAYDPLDKIILIANDDDAPPFVTFISAENREILGQIVFDGVHGPQATGGLEQPVWDPQARRFYMSVPSTTDHPNGEVDQINATTEEITRRFPTSCGPAGLALLPGQRLMTSCGDVLGAKSGHIITTVQGVAADEIWYNPGANRVYFGHQPTYVVDAQSYSVVASILAGSTHSVAADPVTNNIFIPISVAPAANPTEQTGITVWRSNDGDHDRDDR